MLACLRPTNVHRAFIHLAHRTRPPSFHGFHLSDVWASRRYAPAIANTKDLRLRPAWSEIDRHQKAVLSDDFGMGFTTQLLAEELGFWTFVDTLHYIRVLLPQSFVPTQHAKQGSHKSPDFVALDHSFRPSLIECKGTQTSHQALLRAVADGVAQKKSVKPKGPSRLRYSLVIGLFVPQWPSQEEARIHIRDPDFSEAQRILTAHTPDQLARSAVQIDLAKHLAFFRALTTCAFLTETSTEDLRRLPDAVRVELRELARVAGDEPTARSISEPSFDSAASTDSPSRLTIRAPDQLIDQLLRSRDLRGDLDRLASIGRERRWAPEGAEEATLGVRMLSPLGFEFEISTELMVPGLDR